MTCYYSSHCRPYFLRVLKELYQHMACKALCAFDISSCTCIKEETKALCNSLDVMIAHD